LCSKVKNEYSSSTKVNPEREKMSFTEKFIYFISFKTRFCSESNYQDEITEFSGMLLKVDPNPIHIGYIEVGKIICLIDENFSFADAVMKHIDWIAKYTKLSNIICMTLGDWDIKYTFVKECQRFGFSPSIIYNTYINLKKIYRDEYKFGVDLELVNILDYLFGTNPRHATLNEFECVILIWDKLYKKECYHPSKCFTKFITTIRT